MEVQNQVRGYFFLLGILRNQQKDPYCSACSAFANSLRKVREEIAAFEAENGEDLRKLAPEFRQLFDAARSGLFDLQPPAEPSGQKKAGKCKLPEGTCFVKTSLALLQKI